CGPNRPCPGGQTCDLRATPHTCVQSSVTAEKRTLTVETRGMGSVAVEGQAACARASCSYALDGGTRVGLGATPASGWRFAAWSGDCAGSSTDVSVTLDADRDCAATFVEAEQTRYQVTVAAGAGGEVSTDAALPCADGTCAGAVARGTTVTMSAVAAKGHRF